MYTKILSALVLSLSLVIFTSEALSTPNTTANQYVLDAAGYGLTAHDVTGDGYIDLVTSHKDDGGMLLRNDYTTEVGLFTNIQSLVCGRTARFGEIVPGDPWYLAMASNSNPVSANLQTYEVDNGLLDPLNSFSPYARQYDYVAWGYVNNDPYMDLIATQEGSDHYIEIFEGSETGNLESTSMFFTGINSDPDHLELVKLDYMYEDQICEIVVHDGNYIKVFYQDAYGQYTTTGYQYLEIDDICDFTIGDINDDGYNDLVVVTNDNYENYILTFLNAGNGRFNETPSQYEELTPCGFEIQVALGELNYDGFKDIAIIGLSHADIYNNGGESAPGVYDFDDPDWDTHWFVTTHLICEELMFVDLASKGGYSLVATYHPIEDPWVDAVFIFFEEVNYQVTPVQNVQAMEQAGTGYAKITWEPNTELDIDEYNIYRAFMEDSNTRPDREDFSYLATVSHPTAEYIDDEVLWHSGSSNYYVWYAVTGVDTEDNESGLLHYAKGWGYYADGGVVAEILLANPGKFDMAASPNPFNPLTTIGYQLPEAGYITLTVFDITGRKVSELVKGWKDAGAHDVIFDGSGLSSGLYFYRIEADGFSAVKKMVLMK